MAKTTNTRRARASVKHVRMSANKARFVLDMIRNKHVVEAQRILQLTPRAAAHDIRKVLNAAVANAQHSLRLEPESLWVAECYADEGPTMKRWHPRALGRAYRIRRRTCHITVVVEPREGNRGTED